MILAVVVGIGVFGHATPPAPIATPSAPVVAVALAATPAPSPISLIVPVDRINTFIIDDAVRGVALRFVVRMRAAGVPRAL